MDELLIALEARKVSQEPFLHLDYFSVRVCTKRGS